MTQVSVCQSQSKLHSVHPLHFCKGAGEGGGGVELPTKFKKGGLDRTSTFRVGLLGKRGVTFFRGVQLSHNKLRSEIFNDKKSL